MVVGKQMGVADVSSVRMVACRSQRLRSALKRARLAPAITGVYGPVSVT